MLLWPRCARIDSALCQISLPDLTRLREVGSIYWLLCSGEGVCLHPVLSAVLFLSLTCADVA